MSCISCIDSIRESLQRRLCRFLIFNLDRDAPDDAPVFGFNIYAPVAGIESLFKSVSSIATFAPARNLERDFIGVAEWPAAIGTKIPVMVNCSVKGNWSKDGGETVDRLLGREDVVRPFPNLVPLLVKRKFELVASLLHFMIYATEFQCEWHRRDPVEKIEPDEKADEGEGRNRHSDCLAL